MLHTCGVVHLPSEGPPKASGGHCCGCASRRNFFIKTDFDTRRRLSYLSITRENAYPRNLQTYADILASHDFDKNCLTTRQADLSDHIDFNTASLATVRLFIQSESEYHE
jgi:hypothetical protein